MPVCVLFASSRLGIVFNPIVGTITDHSHSTKNIDPYFKSLLDVEDPGHRKPVLILQNGLSKPGKRAHDRNFIFAVGGIRTHNLLIDSPAYYHNACQHHSLDRIAHLTVSEFRNAINTRIYESNVAVTKTLPDLVNFPKKPCECHGSLNLW